MTFDELASRITRKQQDILTWIWKSFSEKKQWPLTRIVHHQFGKDIVVKELRPLGGTIIYDFADVGKQRYQLQLLGVLLSGQGAEVLESLVGYLGYIRKRFMDDPENDVVTAMDILSDGGLTHEQVILIGKTLRMSPFWGGSHGGSDEEWNTQFPKDVDEYESLTDLHAFIKNKLMLQYSPDVPVVEEERNAAGPRIMSEAIRTPEQAKERDQKFEIVLSPKQAKLDFDEWTKEFAGSQTNIAVLFLDIDNFKSLNTAYTETKMDATILPGFMRLLNSLV